MTKQMQIFHLPRWRSGKGLVPIIRGVLGMVFLFSGVMKISDLVSFQEILVRFDLLPSSLIDFTTLMIPSLEFVAGLLLTIGLFQRATASLLIVLLSGFTSAITYKYLQGEAFDCGCFGSLDILSSISLTRIGFNIVLILMIVMVYMNANKKRELAEELKIHLLYSMVLVFVLLGPFNHDERVNAAYAGNIKKIDFETATEMVASQGAIVFDARTLDRYQQSHFDGAFPLPYNDFLNYFKGFRDMPKDAKILVYCDGAMCNASTWVATKLIKRGFKNVLVINENFPEWQNKNFHSGY